MRSIYTFRSALTLHRMSPLRKVTKLYYISDKTKQAWPLHPVAGLEFYCNKMGNRHKCLTKHYAMKTYRGSECIAPCILDFVTS
jgi:hypothetical protein